MGIDKNFKFVFYITASLLLFKGSNLLKNRLLRVRGYTTG